MQLGTYSYANPTILWGNDGTVLKIGKFCSVAANVTVFLGNGYGHDTSFVSTYPFSHIHRDIFNNVVNNSHNTNGDVTIGNDIWIGRGATIMSGIIIGDGAVIAANSHVVKDVESYSIVGGNPAQHIKYRFNKDQRDKLLQIKWWDWDDAKINKFLPLICSSNIDAFINACKR